MERFKSENGVIFRALAYGVFLAIVLCGGCSDNGIGTAIGESKMPSVPLTPLNVNVKVTSSSSVIVDWSSVSSATGYNVYHCNDSNKLAGTTSISYTNTRLSSGTSYSYQVTAYNRGGESPRSPCVSVTTIPDAPDNVSGVVTSQGSVTLSWSPVFGAAGYYIYRGTKADGSDSSKVKTTSDTSYTNTGLLSGTTYYYWVSAYNSGGESSPTPYATIIPPDPPSGISATATSPSTIILKWSSVFGATGYNVYRDTTLDGRNRIKVGTTSSKSDTSYTDKGLLSGTRYYYWVSSNNDGGEGRQSSSPVSAITWLDPPSGLSVTARSSSSVSLKWSPVIRAAGYYVYRSKSVNGQYTKLERPASSTSYTDSGLSSCDTYYYKVSAYNINTERDTLSSPVEAVTLSDPPSVTAVAESSSAVTVNWSSACGAEGYYVYRSEGVSGMYTKVETPIPDTSYRDVDVSSGTTYCYTVSAYYSSRDTTLWSDPPACVTLPDDEVPPDPPDPLVDYRDGKTYATMRTRDGKVWMAENLRYEIPGDSWCYDNDESICEKYGRLYGWAAAMGLYADYYDYTWNNDVNQQGVCPSGWHVPSRREWGNLARDAGGTGTYGAGGTAGTRLKSNVEWNSDFNVPIGTDDYGFSALPGGYGELLGEEFSGAGTVGYWWTASEDYSGSSAYYRSMRYNNETVGEAAVDKRTVMSVRCVQD